jgi:hypothetical protein
LNIILAEFVHGGTDLMRNREGNCWLPKGIISNIVFRAGAIDADHEVLSASVSRAENRTLGWAR